MPCKGLHGTVSHGLPNHGHAVASISKAESESGTEIGAGMDLGGKKYPTIWWHSVVWEIRVTQATLL